MTRVRVPSLSVKTSLLRPWAWMGTLALIVLGVTSNTITMLSIEFIEFYRAMGMTGQQLEMMERMDLNMIGVGSAIMGAVSGLAAFCYLLWIRRRFEAP